MFCIVHCLLPCFCAATKETPKRKYTKKHSRFYRFQLIDGQAVIRDKDRHIQDEDLLQRCTKKDLISKVKLLRERLKDSKETNTERARKMIMKDFIIREKDQEIEELKAKLSVGT